MLRAYDNNGNVVDLVEWEKQIRAEAIEEYRDNLIKQMHNLWSLYKRDLGNRPKPTFMTAFNMVNVIADQLQKKEVK